MQLEREVKDEHKKHAASKSRNSPQKKDYPCLMVFGNEASGVARWSGSLETVAS